MRIAYVANIRLPTEKAHGLQIMQMCDAFARIGHEVTLIVPQRTNTSEVSPWQYYGLPPRFNIICVPVFDFIPYDRWLGNIALWLTTLSFARNARKAVVAACPNLIFSRDAFLIRLAPKGVPFIFEAHDFPSKPWLYRRIWNACTRIVTVTIGLKKAFLIAGVPEANLLTAHDAVDLEKFRITDGRAAARRSLGLPLEGFLALYTGHLYPYKGADDLLEACRHLRHGTHVVFVGGRPDDLARLKARAAALSLMNAIFVGPVQHERIPEFLRAADVAILPTRASDRHSSEFLSPLKLFEYLAASKAIVATDLPSIREVLDDRSAAFVPPQDPSALAMVMNGLAEAPGEVVRLERAAAELAEGRTWTRRAERVLSGLPKPHTPRAWTWRYRSELQVIVLALVLRAGYGLAFPSHLEGSDAWLYIQYADLLRGIPVWSLNMSTYFQPGFPFFLALVRSLFGTSQAALSLAQAAISTATVGLITSMAGRLISRRAGLFAGLMAALSMPAIIESSVIYTETLYSFLLTAAVYVLVRAAFSPAVHRHAAIAGGLFAIAGIVRELALFNALVLAFIMGIYKRSWRLFIGLLAPMAVVLIVFGYSNRLIASEQSVGHVPIFAKNYEATLQDAQSQRYLLRWWLYPEGVWLFFRFPNRLAEISNDVSTKAALFSGDSRIIASQAPYILMKGLLILLHWVILVLAVYGLWRGRMSREAKIIFFVTIAFATGTIIIGSVARIRGFDAFEPLARYRFPVEPLIMILAAAGIDRLLKVHMKPE